MTHGVVWFGLRQNIDVDTAGLELAVTQTDLDFPGLFLVGLSVVVINAMTQNNSERKEERLSLLSRLDHRSSLSSQAREVKARTKEAKELKQKP